MPRCLARPCLLFVYFPAATRGVRRQVSLGLLSKWVWGEGVMPRYLAQPASCAGRRSSPGMSPRAEWTLGQRIVYSARV